MAGGRCLQVAVPLRCSKLMELPTALGPEATGSPLGQGSAGRSS